MRCRVGLTTVVCAREPPPTLHAHAPAQGVDCVVFANGFALHGVPTIRAADGSVIDPSAYDGYTAEVAEPSVLGLGFAFPEQVGDGEVMGR